jgi:hypothetical protein
MDDRAPSEPDDEQTATLEAHEREKHDAYSRWLLAGIPAAIAVLSFALSAYIWYDSNQPPEVELTLPDRARVTQGDESAWLYLQPRFISTASNDRIDVITNLVVDVTPLEEGSPTAFDWDEQGTWVFDHDSRSLTWDWVADPGPLVVSPAAPQMPTGLFMAPSGWLWQPGEYEITVTAETTVSDEVLSESSTLVLSEDTVAQLNDSPGSLFLAIELVVRS